MNEFNENSENLNQLIELDIIREEWREVILKDIEVNIRVNYFKSELSLKLMFKFGLIVF